LFWFWCLSSCTSLATALAATACTAWNTRGEAAMTLTPSLRKLALTLHVTSSMGWFSAVAAFLALAVAGLTSQDVQTARSADLAMDLTAWFVIVPFCFASLLTGLVSSLGTPWGLFRHYWVLVKLLITIPATLILLVHMQPISLLASAASKTVLTWPGADLHGLRNLLVTAAGAALLTLLVLTTLSMYKPRGMTRYGWRRQRELRTPSQP